MVNQNTTNLIGILDCKVVAKKFMTILNPFQYLVL